MSGLGDHLPSNIVVRGTNWIGDTVISLPALKELRRIFPHALITYWSPSVTAPLIQSSGLVDDVISFEQNSQSPVRRSWNTSKRLAGGKFDLAVLFQNAFEGAFTARLAGIPLRAGFPTDIRGPFLNLKVPQSAAELKIHQVYYYLAVTDHLGRLFHRDSFERKGLPDCSLSLSADSLERADEILKSLDVEIERPLFLLCPGSVNSEAKRWPADLFAELADMLISKLRAQVIFVGSPGEAPLIDGIISMMKNYGAMSLAGKADLLTAVSVMTRSALVISNDTGTAHLAVAAKAGVLTIFGPTTPGLTAPFSETARIIQGQASCAPCRHFVCPHKVHPCMRSVTPHAVFEMVEKTLSQNGDNL